MGGVAIARMRVVNAPGANRREVVKGLGSGGGKDAVPGRHTGRNVSRDRWSGLHGPGGMATEVRPTRHGTIMRAQRYVDGGYTPYETLLERFDDVDVVHRSTRVVQAPLSTCMEPWCAWENVYKFLPQLVDVEPMSEDGKIRRLRLMYRFASTPTIELLASAIYVGTDPKEQLKDILQQEGEGTSAGKRNAEVRWRSVEGFPQAGCVKFTERGRIGNERESELPIPQTETVVELEFTYRMPQVLVEFLGRQPIQLDVEKIVQGVMDGYVELCLKKTNAGQT
mmetsp:Transcript_4984/g.31845  ORF Transcript_4984/g.31845 Transcript_4984/m.31845 type:complete len:281 (-) Transcript_4984:4343-5185(-)